MRAVPLPLQGDPTRVPPDPPPGPVDVIVPVAGAPEAFARCLESLVAHTDLERNRLVVVLDGPQPGETRLPEGAMVLENLTRQGFVASANRGMSVGIGDGRDVILLNSDTRVTAGWVEKLQAAAYSAPEVATATPFSNSATICSLPRFLESNALPAGWDADRFGRLVEERSLRARPRLPTGVGVCLYVKRKVLEGIGLLDEKSFGEGYGEESELCMRALKAGYAHVLDDATFIFHEGQRSFGARRGERVRAAHRAMRRLHPEYLATVARFIREDPLRPLRERVVSAIVPPRRAVRGPERVLHLVHGWPPWNSAGTEIYAAGLVRRQARHREAAAYARIADPQRSKGEAVELLDHGARVRLIVNNFKQRDPLSRNALRDRELEADFARLLDEVRPRLLHVHHLAGHVASLVGTAARRKIPILFQLQDWWQPCARVNLLDAWGRLCSGPGLGKCPACRPLTRFPGLNQALYAYRFAVMKGVLRKAAAFVMGSRFIHRSYLDLGYLRPEDRAFVIPYGVEPAPRLPRERGRPLRFGAIGSSLPHKGMHVARAAFAGIDPARAKLTVWGDPPFEEERKPAIFAQMDVLIVPSLGLESFGLAAREAMHHGVPVLASDRGALPEMEYGALFDAGDPASLRAWIERLAAEPEIVDRWAAALPRVKGMDEHAEEIEAVYEQVLR